MRRHASHGRKAEDIVALCTHKAPLVKLVDARDLKFRSYGVPVRPRQGVPTA